MKEKMEMRNMSLRVAVAGSLLVALCASAETNSTSLIEGLPLRAQIPVAAGSTTQHFTFAAQTDVFLVLKPSPGASVDIYDHLDRKVARNPTTDIQLEPLRKGRHKMRFTTDGIGEHSVYVDAMAIGEVMPGAEAKLSPSDTYLPIFGYFFNVETEGDYFLAMTLKYKGKLPKGGGYNIQREGESRNVYGGFHPRYSSRKEGDFNISGISMSGVRLTPGRYYFAFCLGSAVGSHDLSLTVKTRFAPVAR